MKKAAWFLIAFLALSSNGFSETVNLTSYDFNSLDALVKMGGIYRIDGVEIDGSDRESRRYLALLKESGITKNVEGLGKKIKAQEMVNLLSKEGVVSFGKKEIEAFINYKWQEYGGKNLTSSEKEEYGRLVKKRNELYQAWNSSKHPAYKIWKKWKETDEFVRYEFLNGMHRTAKTSIWVPSRILNRKDGESYIKKYCREAHNSNRDFCYKEIAIKEYESYPPSSVLKEISEAQESGRFDYFTIATFETVDEVRTVVDPLVLGRIHGSPRRFFIAQWGDDIKIEDLIGQ